MKNSFADLDGYVLNMAIGWKNHSIKVLRENKPLHVVYYEELVKNPLREIRGMIDFLPRNQRPDDLEQRLSCLSQELTGYNRRKKKPLTFDPYSNKTKRVVNEAIDEVRRVLIEKSFDNPVLLTYTKH